jgi:hypothetical protein
VFEAWTVGPLYVKVLVEAKRLLEAQMAVPLLSVVEIAPWSLKSPAHCR